MTASELLESQMREMREDMASLNRALGALHIHLHRIDELTKDYVGREAITEELQKAQNIISRREGVR